LDDGPRTEEESRAVLAQAISDGTRTIVAVAHANDGHFEVSRDRYDQAFGVAVEEIQAQGWDLRLVPAMEIRLGLEIGEGLECERFIPIGKTGYVCVELARRDFPLFTFEVLDQLRMAGYRLLLIHPERNQALQRRADLGETLRHLGVLGVASAGSLLGQFGGPAAKAAWTLMEQGLIQSVASDGHSVLRRPVTLSPIRSLLTRRYGAAEMAWMMDEVPGRVLDGLAVELRSRSPLGWRRRFSIRGRI
jgi:protein-tyrosine phosphatase